MASNSTSTSVVGTLSDSTTSTSSSSSVANLTTTLFNESRSANSSRSEGEDRDMMTGLAVLLSVVFVVYTATAIFIAWMQRRGKRVDARYRSLQSEPTAAVDDDATRT